MPGWVNGRSFAQRIVLHLDADLYSSTLFVLIHLLPKLKKEDIIIFDEFSSILTEYRAFLDALAAYPREFEALGRSADWVNVALKVI